MSLEHWAHLDYVKPSGEPGGPPGGFELYSRYSGDGSRHALYLVEKSGAVHEMVRRFDLAKDDLGEDAKW